jgi:hypothetical protein
MADKDQPPKTPKPEPPGKPPPNKHVPPITHETLEKMPKKS